MNNRLEQFVRDHREEFDGEEPDNKIWEKLQVKLEPPPQQQKTAPVFRIERTWLSAAAVLILVIAGATWYFAGRHSTTQQDGLAVNQTASGTANPAKDPTKDPAKDPASTTQTPGSTTQEPIAATTEQTQSQLAANPRKSEKPATASSDRSSSEESVMDEEMYHYTRLVELKHKELKTIEKDEPLLYKQFAADVNKLDSVYNGLRRELPKNPNREQLLEAMVQNLQLQMQLLNHQLDIIKQINHSKQKAYEKAYKTV